jgi:hypothetical protein
LQYFAQIYSFFVIRHSSPTVFSHTSTETVAKRED